MDSEHNNSVVVIGADHHNTLGVVESLGEKGIYSNVVLLSKYRYGYVLHSKYVTKGWCCSNDGMLIDCLKEHFTDRLKKAVIFVTNDHAANLLDKNYDILKDYFYIPTVCPAGTLAEKMNKENMSVLARQVGLNVPMTWIVNNRSIPNNIVFPIITKAISSVFGGKSDIRICYNQVELEEFISQQPHCSTLQIQQFIDKEYEFQLLGCSINAGKEILIPGRTHIIRPNGIDNTFFLRFDKCEDSLATTLSKAVDFVKRTSYFGAFSIEFLKGKDGKIYFTEMNFRNDGNAICVTKAGTNIPYIIYLSLTGGDYKNEIIHSTINRVYLVPEIYYLSRLFAHEFGFKEWYQNMRKANCFTTYFKNDKAPFFWFIILAIWKRLPIHK